MYLTKDDIQKWQPFGPRPRNISDLKEPLRTKISQAGHYTPEQIAGRNFPIACVALEITQRCNLDCTLCYLSDIAETVKDVPLFELKRRIKHIYDHYGPHTNIQITGGDPTLRSLSDLVEIVRNIKSYPMRCALFTNGIKVNDEMLQLLSDEGLDDVVFHVDMTQERKSYNDEIALNVVRLSYINLAKNYPVRILFNTTIFDQNVKDIPKLVQFFISHAEFVSLASFQMQAETGRGVLRERDLDLITQQKVMSLIEDGAGIPLHFDLPLIGHPDCNKYTTILKSGSVLSPLYDAPKFFKLLFSTLALKKYNWSVKKDVLPQVFKSMLQSPQLFILALHFIIKKFLILGKPFLLGHKIHHISFFIHNFMDAQKLEHDRCESCVFMVATANGPMSMCVHNAKRDQMITQKIPDTPTQKGWNPLDERLLQTNQLPLKKLKGRLRAQADKVRKANA